MSITKVTKLRLTEYQKGQSDIEDEILKFLLNQMVTTNNPAHWIHAYNAIKNFEMVLKKCEYDKEYMYFVSINLKGIYIVEMFNQFDDTITKETKETFIKLQIKNRLENRLNYNGYTFWNKYFMFKFTSRDVDASENRELTIYNILYEPEIDWDSDYFEFNEYYLKEYETEKDDDDIFCC